MLARLVFFTCLVGLAACGAGPEFDGRHDWDGDHIADGLDERSGLKGHMLPPRLAPAKRADELPRKFRIMAANITAGRQQSYDTGEGTRIFQGLKPDIALVQEMNIGENSLEELRAYVDEAFGPEFYVFREEDAQIPNAIVSRYPIIGGGQWPDPALANRDFAWARIDLPGEKELFAVSVHLSAGNNKLRTRQAEFLANVIPDHVQGDFLVVGGDFNTSGGRVLDFFDPLVDTDAPPPTDNLGNDGTNRSRKTRIDWVLADDALASYEVPVEIGSQAFPTGLVFDSRTYSPLSDVSPVQKADSNASNMQHMAVMRDFNLQAAN